jgi:5-methylcytosine-specific restriction endonuclease McrA
VPTSNQIPTKVRARVKVRARFRCERCGAPAPSGEVHHRRSRSVRDQHTHCCCVLVLLCGTCHRWVHAHPFEARTEGLIVSRFVDEPGTVPQVTAYGLRIYHCDGGTEHKEQP